MQKAVAWLPSAHILKCRLQLRHCSDGRNLITHRNSINTAFQYFKGPLSSVLKAHRLQRSVLCAQWIRLTQIVVAISLLWPQDGRTASPNTSALHGPVTNKDSRYERYVKCIVYVTDYLLKLVWPTSIQFTTESTNVKCYTRVKVLFIYLDTCAQFSYKHRPTNFFFLLLNSYIGNYFQII